MYGMKFDYSYPDFTRVEGDSNARRHDQATRRGQRILLQSRRRRTGVVLPQELGARELRPVERGSAGQLRGRAVRERSESGQRPDRKLSKLVLFDIDGTLVL